MRGAHDYIGAAVPRVEDEPLLTGAGSFVADVAADGRLEAAFVRSGVAHGKLLSVDVGGAVAMPGVAAAYVADDLGLRPMPFPPRTEAPDEMTRPPLAEDKVRFVGEPVAVVVAEDRYVAEEAAAAVTLQIEPLPPVLDVTRAAEPSAPTLFDGVGNVANVREVGDPVDDVIASAPVVVTGTYVIGRVAPCSIETHGILAIPGDHGLTVWCGHQAPHRLKGALARPLGLDPDDVRVISPDVGGAFGAKSQTFPEYLIVCEVARRLGRPVRWIEDRQEAFVATTHGRGQHQSLTLAADESGRLLALRAEIDADIGAYPHTGEFVPSMTMWVISGCYRIPRIHARTRAVVTNKTPTASYRGAGRPEAAFGLERTMDLLAARLDLDPAELRVRNFIAPEAFPYRSPTGAIYDSGRYGKVLRRALELAEYASVRAEQRRRRSAGGRPLGIGICSYIERSGGSQGTNEFGAIEVHADGAIECRSGTSSQGQGHATALAQVVASAFDVPMDRVRVVQADTAEVAQGTGTFGSRSIQVGAGAVYEASTRVLERARAEAARLFGVAPEALTYSDGTFASEGGVCVTLEEIAARADGLSASAEFAPPQAFPFGSHVAVVEVDRDTGRVHILRLVSVDDCGEVVNPAIVRGQAIGSIVQGLGQALMETAPYADDGTPLATSLFSYAIPSAAVVPPMVHEESVTPNPNVPLGAKGAGESGCIGTPPALVNAVADAIGYRREDGLDMPLTPEKVWRALREITPSGA